MSERFIQPSKEMSNFILFFCSSCLPIVRQFEANPYIFLIYWFALLVLSSLSAFDGLVGDARLVRARKNSLPLFQRQCSSIYKKQTNMGMDSLVKSAINIRYNNKKIDILWILQQR